MLTIILALFLAITSADTLFANDFIEFNDLDLSIDLAQNTQEEDDMINIGDAARCQGSALPAAEIVKILTGPGSNPPATTIGLQNLLQFDFYHGTHPADSRTLHELPILEVLPSDNRSCWSLQVQPFFNMTKKMYLTPCSSKILSYIDLLANEDFLNIIDEKDFTRVDIPDVISLFGQITLEERRLGAMLSVSKEYNRWFLSAALPAYYLERNFFLDQKYKDKLDNSPLFSGVGTQLPGLNLDTFVNKHLVSDKGGFGDLRLQAFYKVLHTDEERPLYFGAEVTFPTAHAVKTGIIGGNFCPKSPPRLIDFAKMFSLFAGTPQKSCMLELSELVVGYGIEALDRLTATLADAPLGQQHVVLGPVLYTKQPLGFTTSIEFFGELQWSAPATEVRFFKVKKNPADFNRDYENDDEDIAQSNLNFLMQQATNTLYPTVVKIRTHPGMVAHFNTALITNWNEYFTSVFGYDFWAQMKERLGHVTHRYTPGGPLDFAAGTKHSAREGKLFGSLTTNFCSTNYNVHVTLSADATVSNYGIGRSATAALALLFDF